jgi:hypothetical protein
MNEQLPLATLAEAEPAQRGQHNEAHVGENNDSGAGAAQPETRAVALLRPSPIDHETFNWGNKYILLYEQPLTAVYEDTRGFFVIRQPRDDDNGGDDIIAIAPNNLRALINKLCDLAGIQ